MRGGDRGQGRSRHPVKREKGSRTHPNSYQAPSGARCTRVRRGSRRVRTHALTLLLLIWEKELGGKMFAQRPVCKRLSRLRSPCPRLGNDPVSLASRWTSTLRRGHTAERHSESPGAHDSRVPGVGRTPTPPGESPGCRGPRRPMLLLCPTRGCSPPPGGPLARAQAGAGQCPPLGEPGSPTSQLPLGILDAAGEAHSPPRPGATYREGARSPCSVKLGGRSPRVQGAADGCSARGRHVGGNEKSPCEEITEPCTRSCSEER